MSTSPDQALHQPSAAVRPLSGRLSRRDTFRYAAMLGLAAGIPIGVGGCGGAASPAGEGSGSAGTATGALAMSNVARKVPAAGAHQPAVPAVTRFTEAVFARLLTEKPADNLCVSPYSIATALGMTVNGARGRTAQEMLTVLGGLSLTELDAALSALDALLVSRSRTHQLPGGTAAEVVFAPANSLWGQQGMTWNRTFLDDLAGWFGAGMREVDYAGDAEGARRALNGWVASQTRDRIPELLARGIVTTATRLVLVNALCLKAPWLNPFATELTTRSPFRVEGREAVTAELMTTQVAGGATARGAGWVAATLPYAGSELGMTVVLSERADAASHAALVGSGGLAQVLAALQPGEATVTMPKFTIRTKTQLKPLLSALGMPTAFTPAADFSGISAASLVIDEVVHEAYVAVDEAGTEAAAATAVGVREVGAPAEPMTLLLDRPFLYVIHDLPSGAPIFVGRVADPTRGIP